MENPTKSYFKPDYMHIDGGIRVYPYDCSGMQASLITRDHLAIVPNLGFQFASEVEAVMGHLVPIGENVSIQPDGFITAEARDQLESQWIELQKTPTTEGVFSLLDAMANNGVSKIPRPSQRSVWMSDIGAMMYRNDLLPQEADGITQLTEQIAVVHFNAAMRIREHMRWLVEHGEKPGSYALSACFHALWGHLRDYNNVYSVLSKQPTQIDHPLYIFGDIRTWDLLLKLNPS